MRKEEYIKTVNGFTSKELDNLIDTYGIDNIKKKDLDLIIKQHGYGVTLMHSFLELYTVKSAEESGNIMKVWTVVIGFTTILVTTLTLFR